MSPLLLAQSTLEAIIRKRIEGRHGISVELGTELVGFDQNNGVVTAYLRKNGTEGAEETIEVPYLIGTDGGRSPPLAFYTQVRALTVVIDRYSQTNLRFELARRDTQRKLVHLWRRGDQGH